MKNIQSILILFMAFFSAVPVVLASNLPACPSDESVYWHNCFGTLNFEGGNKYVGEFRDDQFNGKGTYTYASGKEERGYHMNNEYVPTICENMGLRKGTESFGKCVVSLINEINEGD